MLKRALLLVTVGLMLMLFAAVQADSMDDVICGALSEADCQILLTNAEVMDDVYSMSFNMALAMSVDGDGLDDSFSMTGRGSGNLAVDPATADALEAAAAATADSDVASLLERLLAAVTGDVSINMSGASGQEAFEMELHLLLKDGVIVFGAGAMEGLTGQPMEGLEWFGVDTSGAIGDILSEAGMGSALDAASTSPPAMKDAETEATAVTRLPDEVIGGITVAVFESSVDINSILEMLILEDIQAAAGTGEGADADMAIAMVQNIDARKMSSRTYIGLDDHYTYKTDMEMELTMRGESVDMAEGDVNLTMSFSINFSAFNLPVSVEIPEEAFVLPLAMLMQMGSQ